jgi:hypothetical protein
MMRFPSNLFVVAALLATPAQAAIYTEVGDAGNTIATAQHITEPNTRTIIGTILNQADSDMFGFNWPTSGNFTIDHLITSDLHRFLVLYDPLGGLVAGSGVLVGLVVPNLFAGDYYLSIEGADEQSYRLEFNNAIIPIAVPEDDPSPVPAPATLPLISIRKQCEAAVLQRPFLLPPVGAARRVTL